MSRRFYNYEYDTMMNQKCIPPLLRQDPNRFRTDPLEEKLEVLDWLDNEPKCELIQNPWAGIYPDTPDEEYNAYMKECFEALAKEDYMINKSLTKEEIEKMDMTEMEAFETLEPSELESSCNEAFAEDFDYDEFDKSLGLSEDEEPSNDKIVVDDQDSEKDDSIKRKEDALRILLQRQFEEDSTDDEDEDEDAPLYTKEQLEEFMNASKSINVEDSKDETSKDEDDDIEEFEESIEEAKEEPVKEETLPKQTKKKDVWEWIEPSPKLHEDPEEWAKIEAEIKEVIKASEEREARERELEKQRKEMQALESLAEEDDDPFLSNFVKYILPVLPENLQRKFKNGEEMDPESQKQLEKCIHLLMPFLPAEVIESLGENDTDSDKEEDNHITTSNSDDRNDFPTVLPCDRTTYGYSDKYYASLKEEEKNKKKEKRKNRSKSDEDDDAYWLSFGESPFKSSKKNHSLFIDDDDDLDDDDEYDEMAEWDEKIDGPKPYISRYERSSDNFWNNFAKDYLDSTDPYTIQEKEKYGDKPLANPDYWHDFGLLSIDAGTDDEEDNDIEDDGEGFLSYNFKNRKSKKKNKKKKTNKTNAEIIKQERMDAPINKADRPRREIEVPMPFIYDEDAPDGPLMVTEDWYTHLKKKKVAQVAKDRKAARIELAELMRKRDKVLWKMGKLDPKKRKHKKKLEDLQFKLDDINIQIEGLEVLWKIEHKTVEGSKLSRFVSSVKKTAHSFCKGIKKFFKKNKESIIAGASFAITLVSSLFIHSKTAAAAG